jgi:hypothetical protein
MLSAASSLHQHATLPCTVQRTRCPVMQAGLCSVTSACMLLDPCMAAAGQPRVCCVVEACLRKASAQHQLHHQCCKHCHALTTNARSASSGGCGAGCPSSCGATVALTSLQNSSKVMSPLSSTSYSCITRSTSSCVYQCCTTQHTGCQTRHTDIASLQASST